MSRRNQVSTEGCLNKWKQRGPRKKRKTAESEEDDCLKELARNSPRTSHPIDVYSERPNDDGVVNRTSTRSRSHPRRKKATKSTVDVDHNIVGENLFQEEIDDPGSSLESLMAEIIGAGENVASEWQNRQEEVQQNWETHRSFIAQRVVEFHNIDEDTTFQCMVCSSSQATLRCLDCMGSFMCEECDTRIHSLNPLHDRQAWRNGRCQFLPQEFGFPKLQHYRCPCLKCGSDEFTDVNDGKYIVITRKGRFDVPKTKRVCCRCAAENRHIDLCNVIQRGFWPANPDMKSQYLFERNVLQLFHAVSMRLPGSSLNGFINALGDISEKYGRKRQINQTVFTRALSEHIYMEEEMLLLKRQDSMKCPPCTVDQLMGHVDGNHKVYRYLHVESGNRTSYHKDRFIVDDDKVEKHTSEVYSKHPSKNSQDIYCGTSKWKAAREVSSKYTKLDETGLVVAGCRHAVAQKAVNMKQGELYAYSHYLHVNFMAQNGVKFIWQDVVCKYWPWAKKIATSCPVWQSAVSSMKPALGIMHAHGHSWHCQVLWSGRYVEGAGGGSGEDMEQFFSHLSRTGNTTKYMSSPGRRDTLTNHTLYWNRRKISSLPELLCSRYQKTKKMMDQTVGSLEQVMVTIPEERRQAVVEEWKDEIIQSATVAGKPIRERRKGALQEYFKKKQEVLEADLLKAYIDKRSPGLATMIGSNQLYSLIKERSDQARETAKEVAEFERQLNCSLDDAKQASIDAAVKSVQREIEATVGSRHQRAQAMELCATSSKQKSHLRTKNEKDKKRVVVLIRRLCDVQLEMGISYSYSLESILKGNFPWKLEDSTDWTVKKKATDLYMLQKRLEEEVPLLKKEMLNYLKYFINIKKALKEDIAELKDAAKRFEPDAINHGNLDTEENMQEENKRYYVDKDKLKVVPRPVIKGLHSIKEEGLLEINKNINWALTCFKHAISSDGWRSMVLDVENEFIDDYEDDDDDEEFLLIDAN